MTNFNDDIHHLLDPDKSLAPYVIAIEYSAVYLPSHTQRPIVVFTMCDPFTGLRWRQAFYLNSVSVADWRLVSERLPLDTDLAPDF